MFFVRLVYIMGTREHIEEGNTRGMEIEPSQGELDSQCICVIPPKESHRTCWDLVIISNASTWCNVGLDYVAKRH